MDKLPIIKAPSPNYNERRNNAEIDMLVIHYTGMPTSQDALLRMQQKESEVSAHYMIDENGEVYQLVEEKYRAWHAGVSFWRGNKDVNSSSIGIELVNKGHEFGYHNFASLQMKSLITLSKEILNRYNIPQYNIVGHSDVSPTRKTDPGERFDWKELHKNGIGLWINEDDTLYKDIDTINFDTSKGLALIGYDISDLEAAIIAFKRHFMADYNLTPQIDSKTFFRIFQISHLI
ncbi:MAG: N-acetylmuramoyl-L-alanine amidase [Alphaproteobacteria bacterium]